MGVPQGSVLGPLLFLVYINDLMNVNKCTIKMFADDTSVFLKGDDPVKLKHEAENCLVQLSDWFKSNQLVVNDNKTSYVVFTKKKCIPQILSEIKINNITIQRKNSVKYLGIILDTRLDFKEYITTQLSKNLVKIISAFKIIKKIIPKNNKMKLYHAYFHSKLNYGIEVYGSAANRYLKKVEILQHKALKILFNHEPLTPSNYLLKNYKILSVKDHHVLNIAKFVFKCRNNLIPSPFRNHYQDNLNSDYPNTRHRYLLKLQVRTEQGKTMIKYKGAKFWNTLMSETDSRLISQKLSLKQFIKYVKFALLKCY
jgi:hypothetical protein